MAQAKKRRVAPDDILRAHTELLLALWTGQRTGAAAHLDTLRKHASEHELQRLPFSPPLMSGGEGEDENEEA